MAPSTPGGPKPARLYIQASHAYGKVHMLHQKLPGFTACGWVWARTGAATPLAAVTPPISQSAHGALHATCHRRLQ